MIALAAGGVALIGFGAAIAAAAVVAPGPFIGALLGPALVVAGWALLSEAQIRARARRAAERQRRRGGYLYDR